MSKPKKKFKDTKVGKFLIGKSGIIDVISNILPDQGALGIFKPCDTVSTIFLIPVALVKDSILSPRPDFILANCYL